MAVIVDREFVKTWVGFAGSDQLAALARILSHFKSVEHLLRERDGQMRVITHLVRRMALHRALQVVVTAIKTTIPYQKYLAKALPTIGIRQVGT